MAIHAHYLSCGGYYPIGGPDVITRNMIPVIERAGGRVLVRATVSEIVVANGKALGVKVLKGKSEHLIRAKEGVISAAGYGITRKLTNNELPPLPDWATPSIGHITIFIGLKGSAEELKLPSCNYWMLEGMDVNVGYEKVLENLKDEFCQKGVALGFLGFPAAKDPSFSKRHPGKSVAVLISEIPWEMMEEWKDEKIDHRSEEYKALKKKCADHLMEATMWKYFPHLKDKVDYVKVGTPLSTAYYLGKERGESYGLSFPVERFSEGHTHLRPFTPIRNLFLTGQDIITPGWAGALGAAEFTIGSILGYFDLSVILSGKTLWKDLVAMPRLQKKHFASSYDFGEIAG